MKVWVVVSDIGLNGVYVHGVYSSPPPISAVDELIHAKRVSSWTGYGGTSIEEFELNGAFDAPA